MEQEEARANQVLEAARLRAKEEKLKIRTSLLRTRNAGATLVDEAKQRNADVIYLAAEHAPKNGHSLGPVATYLLEKRPTRIVIETIGGGARPHARPPYSADRATRAADPDRPGRVRAGVGAR